MGLPEDWWNRKYRDSSVQAWVKFVLDQASKRNAVHKVNPLQAVGGLLSMGKSTEYRF